MCLFSERDLFLSAPEAVFEFLFVHAKVILTFLTHVIVVVSDPSTKEPHKDALLPPPNKGYVEGLNKEYLKIKLPSHLSIPTYPDDVKPSFQKAQTSMLDLMLHILTAIASSKGS